MKQKKEIKLRFESFIKQGEVPFTDLEDLARSVHFIDSGNYHYMSALWLDMVKEPFSLVVLDHHPDMQPPMFGDILSCGGWVLNVLENNPCVRDVHVIGADRELISKLDKEIQSKAKFYDLEDIFDAGTGDIRLPETEYPVYLSIDKDVIARDELVTNWDQGEARWEDVTSFTRKILSDRQVIGVDICGECAPDQEDCDVALETEGNDEFNKDILEYIYM
jgi:arginase family enzyme